MDEASFVIAGEAVATEGRGSEGDATPYDRSTGDFRAGKLEVVQTS
ncbi:hypothetical protein Pcac1_g24349 [Phytophthora cactorum]|uniref:Uncharacterized protein n=1 Tax=Phytophthora cactorum TaxID=29920 RepID=A0A8T1CA95_9STRA|nr:hypothetical protein Pcac1_g24349 [Phytophthora cactorum]KAG3087396.1 hypothetical protein PI125_g18670 [Phytophthora idaei]KAG2889740.1 hypothetical protein PC114_g17815 [Phytophthora cactorum]KAG2917846.1 hypothetical protein PC117_g17266 [Phytophthora cactorum]KAG2999537.1 hypothetical protein PC119_g17191 [Phytophthora cactorum]